MTMPRKVMNPTGFTFPDSTSVPHGSYLAASPCTANHLAENVTDPEVFNGMQFYEMWQAQDRDGGGGGVTVDKVDIGGPKSEICGSWGTDRSNGEPTPYPQCQQRRIG